MKKLNRFVQFNSGTFVAGLFMVVMLAACVNVQVQCPAGGVGDGPVGCNSVPYTLSALNFKNTVTGQLVTDPAVMCSGVGSKKCNPTTPPGPGRCGFGPSCINWYNPTNNVCKCDCP